jgi:hypothetical protein
MKKLNKAIKEFNEEIHIASDLTGQDLLTLDESEVDDFLNWSKRNKKGDFGFFFYKK